MAGAVKLVIPKNTTIIYTKEVGVGGSDFIGELTTLNSGSLDFGFNQLTKITANNANILAATNNAGLTEFSANNATSVYASNCALTAKSIGDFLIAASTNNPTAIGTAIFSAGTNAIYGDVASYLTGIGVSLPGGSLTGWITQNLPNWIITLN